MPKCASTSIEAALNPYSDLLTKNNVSLKHVNYKNYKKFIEPFLEKVTSTKPEVICIMREPVDWLHSWYRYRKREELKGNKKSTLGLTFDEFCRLYMENKAYVGKQSIFLSAKGGSVGPDRIFKYEELELLKDYFEERIGKEIDFPKFNISLKEDLDISKETYNSLKQFLKRDYEVYNSL
jgi:hypothetical protein